MEDLITAIAPMVVALIGIIPTIIANRKKTDKKIEDVAESLQKHIDSDNKEHAKDCRARILQFAGDVRRGLEFDADAWNAITIDCKFYIEYCTEHPDFQNGICKSTITFLDKQRDELVALGVLDG